MISGILAFATFFLLGALVLICTRLGKTYLYCCTVGYILVSNITVTKQVEFFGFATSLGVIIYSLVYLATDICSEYGEEGDSYRLAISNLVAQIIFFAYIFLSIRTPAGEFDTAHSQINALFSITPRITIAAIVAALGAFVDIYVYEFLKKKTGLGFFMVGLRNNSSTMVGQIINTVIFFTVAFYNVIPNLMEIIITAAVVKIIIALIDTPFIWLARYFLPKEWKDEIA